MDIGSISFKDPHVLLVEGNEAEVNFFQAAADYHSLGRIQIVSVGGKDSFKTFLPIVRKLPGFEQVVSLGIVRDAEVSYKGTLESLRGSLSRAGLAQPSAAMVKASGKPAVTLFIAPGGGRDGMLEDLCWEMVQGEPVIDCVEKFIQCTEASLAKSLPRKSKSIISAYLATKDYPGLRLGEAARADYWPFGVPAANVIGSFLSIAFK